MNKKNIIASTLVTIVVGISVALTSYAYADKLSKTEKINAQLAETKVSLQEAVQIAEAHMNGQAYEAELEDNSFVVEYEVKLISDNLRYEVTIDTVTGDIKRVRLRD